MNIKVKVPATTANFGPGFDCLGAALDLYNEFEVKKLKNQKLRIEVFGEGADVIAKNEKNIVYKAIKKVCCICDKSVPNISIKIVSKIPIERGLGSSASAIVAGVLLGNILCGEKLSVDELINIATELEGHPDNIVAAIKGGLCIAREVRVKVKNSKVVQVKYIKLNMPDDLCALIFIPEVKVLTEKVRSVLPKVINYESAVKNLGNTALLIASILNNKYSLISFAMEDYLHQPFRKKIMPWMQEIFQLCLNNKSLGVALSGSGSSILALYRKEVLNKNLAEKIKKLIDEKVTVEYKILNFVKNGAQLI